MKFRVITTEADIGVTQAGSITYTYGAAGDRLTAGTNTFIWDWAGRLASFDLGTH